MQVETRTVFAYWGWQRQARVGDDLENSLQIKNDALKSVKIMKNKAYLAMKYTIQSQTSIQSQTEPKNQFNHEILF